MEPNWGDFADNGSEGDQTPNLPRKFVDEPFVFLSHEDKEFYEGIKKSTIVSNVFFDGQCTQWDLILDTLRENQSITSCSFNVSMAPNNAMKSIAEYLSFCKVKTFCLTVYPDEEQDPIDEQLYQIVADAIKSNMYITDIAIGGYSILEETVFEALKAHPTITTLQTGSSSGAGSLDRIIRLLNKAPNIRTLRILSIDSEDQDQIINLTRASKNLTQLEFHEGVLLGRQLIDLFEHMVKDNCQLKGLCLDMCYVSGYEKEVGKFLAGNLPMESFGLRSAGIGTSDKELAKYVAEGLAQNTHLKELDLRENSAIDAILPVLKTHQSITSIDFRGNSATKETIEQLAEVLKYNTILRVLRFSQYEYFSLNPIFRSLKDNQTLTELDTMQFGCSYDNEELTRDLDVLKEMMESNHSLIRFRFEDALKNPEIKDAVQHDIKSFTERNKLAQRLNVTNTLQTIAMIVKSKSFNEKVPREIWKHIYSFVKYPGVVMDFCGRM